MSLHSVLQLAPRDSESRIHFTYSDSSGPVFRLWPLGEASGFEILTSTDMSNWSPLDSDQYQLSGDFLDIDFSDLAHRAFLKISFSDGVGE